MMAHTAALRRGRTTLKKKHHGLDYVVTTMSLYTADRQSASGHAKQYRPTNHSSFGPNWKFERGVLSSPVVYMMSFSTRNAEDFV